jgi:hypothetical protein
MKELSVTRPARMLIPADPSDASMVVRSSVAKSDRTAATEPEVPVTRTSVSVRPG